MFVKACVRQKFARNFNPLLYCFAHTNILSSQKSLTKRLLSIDNVYGISTQVKNAVGNKKQSLLLSSNAAAHCRFYNCISFATAECSKIKAGQSPVPSKNSFLNEIRPNYSSDPVRWYSDKKLERSLNKEIDVFDNSHESWGGQNSTEPFGELSKDNNFLQEPNAVQHVEADKKLVYTDRNAEHETERDLYFRNNSSSVEDDEEILLPSETNSENGMLLMTMIGNTRSYSEVLEVYDKHQNKLKNQHYALIVRKLTTLIDRSQLTIAQEHPVMLQLCNQLTKDCCYYNPPMLISLLKFLSKTKMPTNSPVVLATLQMLRKQFNNLDLKQLLYVDILLHNNKQESLGSALMMAVPLALEYRYRNEPLPSDLSPFHLIHGLAVCVKSDTVDSMGLAEKFMMALYEHEKGLKEMIRISAVNLVSGLLKMFLRWKKTQGSLSQEILDDDDMEAPLEDGSSEVEAAQELKIAREVLLKEALQYIAKNINRFSHYEVEKVLSWLSYSYTQKDWCAYNQALLSAYARRTIDHNRPLRSMAGGVMWMLKMNAVDESLLQAVLQKLSSMSTQQLLDTELYIMPLVHAFAASSTLASRSEEERHALLARLLQHPSAQLDPQDAKLPYTRLGIDLACLGYFDPEVHRNILDLTVSDIARSGFAVQRRSCRHSFLRFWQAQQLLNTKHDRVQVDNTLLAASKEFVISEYCSSPSKAASLALVRDVLLQALSSYGPNSLISGVHTRHGVCVDHVIVVRGESEVVQQPTTLSEGMVCLDDLLVPDNARILGVLQVGPQLLLNNYTKLRPQLRLTLQLLAAEGVTVVPFIMPQFLLHYRTDEEKMRYVNAAFCQHRLYL